MPSTSATLVKICGITRLEDGMAALEAGADWLGFIRWPRSARCQPPEACAALTAALRARAARQFDVVGVYVDAEAETIEREAKLLGLDRIQLHGAETAAFADETTRRTGRPVLKVVRVRDAASLAAADAYPGFDLLTDTFDSRLPGGTGRGYDYSLLRALTARRRVIVAGGLDAGTVGDVIRLLRPWGVDVSSAVEASPGVKDPMKVREFIRVVRQADREGRAADRG